jgi:guanidinopropionase
MTSSTKINPAVPNFDAPRYAEIATLLRAPLATALEEVDLGLIGVPYDGALTNRPGARHGPREVRNQSSLTRAIHHVTRMNPFEICRMADLGDVPFEHAFDVEGAHADIDRFFSMVHSAGVVPLAVGGDHSITLPIFRAIAKDGPIGMVHIDAHTDTWDVFQDCKFNHGSPFRRAIEEGLLDPRRTIQIGIRGAQNIAGGWDYSIEQGIRVIFIEELNDAGVPKIIEEARRIVGDGKTYFSFDIDALDPVFAPGTGTPEIGGVTTIQAQALVRGMAGLSFVGGDLVEISPPFDQTGNTALVGASILYEMACVLAPSAASARKARAR